MLECYGGDDPPNRLLDDLLILRLSVTIEFMDAFM